MQLDILLSTDDFKSKLSFNGIPFSLDCHHWLLYYVFNYCIFIKNYLFYRMIVKKKIDIMKVWENVAVTQYAIWFSHCEPRQLL